MAKIKQLRLPPKILSLKWKAKNVSMSMMTKKLKINESLVKWILAF